MWYDIVYHSMNIFELKLREKLEDLRDEAYGDFVARGLPGIPRERVLGVRVPEMRAAVDDLLMLVFRQKIWSRELTEKKESGLDLKLYHEMNNFLEDLPHPFLEYDIAHVEIISQMGNFEECMIELNRFLPYVNNWEVCDVMNPRVFRKNLGEVGKYCADWMGMEKPYKRRFGVVTMMRYFLDEKYFSLEQLDLIVKCGTEIRDEWTDEETYYVQMAVAWYFATALCKQWEAALTVLTEERLPKWVHNKAIQKAVESRRITEEQKDLLRGLKIS